MKRILNPAALRRGHKRRFAGFALASLVAAALLAAPVSADVPVVTVPSPITAEATSGSGASVTFTVTSDQGLSPTCDHNSGDVFPFGTTTVSCSATNAGGETGIGTFTITIKDTTPPSVTVPANITQEATSSSGAAVTFSASANDAVDGSTTPSCSPGSGSTFGIGTTTVTCSATDTHGNPGSATFHVTVQDTTNPTVAVPSDITTTTTVASGKSVTFSASASDNIDGPITPSCSPASGANFPVGTTTVTCTATDAHGNPGSASFHVTVTLVDTTPPVVTVPSDITTTTTVASGKSVSFSASASDNIDGPITPSCSPASGANFPVGTTTVTCTATDAHGNPGSASFHVTVTLVDTTPPVVTVPSDITTTTTVASGIGVTFSASATDNIDGPRPTTCNPASGANFPVGTTTVTCSATDTHGNTGSAFFHVTVTFIDTTPPVLTVPGNMSVSATNASGAVVTFTATATDAVDPSPTVTCSPASGSTFPLGTTTVNCTAKDASGNTSAKSFTVTVSDTTPPTIALAAPADGARINVAAALSASGVGDNVGVGGVTFRYCDSTSGSCAPASGQSVAGADAGGGTWTAAPGALADGHVYTWDAVATDTTGHATTTGSRTFTIDTSVPVVVVPSDLTVEANGPTGSKVTYTVTGSDNGEALLANAITCAPASGSLFAIGSVTVTCSTAPDVGGNVGHASFKVTVADTTPPQLAVPGDFGVYATGDGGIASSDSAVANVLGAAKAVDLVDPHPVVTNNAPDVLPHGTTTVTFTAKDATGNTATKVTHITVTDRPPSGGSGPAPAPVVDTTAPNNPGSFLAKVVPGTITLTWKLPSDSDFDHVEIFRSVQQAPRTTAAPTDTRVYSGTGTSFVDKGLTAGTEYRYLIASFDKTGNRSAGVVIVAVAKAAMLLAPPDSARVSRVPTLRWKAVTGATYYNIQLYRGKSKVLSVWPTGTSLALHLSWKYNGTKYALTPGLYHWFVWPGVGARAAGRYGAVLGDRTFTVLTGIKP